MGEFNGGIEYLSLKVTMVPVEYLWNIYISVHLIYWSLDQDLITKMYRYEARIISLLQISENSKKFVPKTIIFTIQMTTLRLTCS